VYKGARVVAEIEGDKGAGINRALWDMSMTTEEQRAQIREQQRLAQERRQQQPAMGRFRRGGARGAPAPPGEYTISLTVNGRTLSQKAVIMKDHWYDKY